MAHVIALKTDGTLWSCGRNAKGQLGIGVVVYESPVSSPVQIGSLTTWTACGAGLQTGQGIAGGKLYTWGQTPNGQDGRGGDHANDAISSPVQVGSLTDWANVTGGGSAVTAGQCAALKTNDTLWTWGFKGAGSIGDGNNISRSSPVQVGSLTDWTDIPVIATNFMVARKQTDDEEGTGTIWVWGDDNDYGDMAQGDRFDRSSPIQIGTQTGWTGITAHAGTGMAMGKNITNGGT
jgi:alpha-tubulin suppressor-like RCC1 family protein